MKGIFFICILVWTMVSIILHLCGVGAFAEWPITAHVWHWSCLCILYWDLILTGALIFLCLCLKMTEDDD